MALKLNVFHLFHLPGFGPIQNYMALKPFDGIGPNFYGFGPIQNYMALKQYRHRQC